VLAVLIRLATGSAPVATITASSLVLGLVEGLGTGQVSLVVLAVGAGRCSSRTSTTPDSGSSTSTSEFPWVRPSDLVGHGDDPVRDRLIVVLLLGLVV